MSSPSEVVTWECSACAYTNEDATCCNYILCQTRCPVRYASMAGATAAAMARTTRVDCCKQVRVATLAKAAPAVAGEVPSAANWPPAVVESAAIPLMQTPQLGRNHAHAVALQCSSKGSGSAAAAWRWQHGGSTASAAVAAATATAVAGLRHGCRRRPHHPHHQ
jgi:hypothetical protein